MPDQVSSDPVPEDWLAEWQDAAKNYSEEQMQTVLAKILAGEITQPGSFSKQTLAVVKMLSPSDVLAFTTLGSFVWRINDVSTAILFMNAFPPVPPEQGLVDTLIDLEGLGLSLMT